MLYLISKTLLLAEKKVIKMCKPWNDWDYYINLEIRLHPPIIRAKFRNPL